jgi:hypothetical protein
LPALPQALQHKLELEQRTKSSKVLELQSQLAAVQGKQAKQQEQAQEAQKALQAKKTAWQDILDKLQAEIKVRQGQVALGGRKR